MKKQFKKEVRRSITHSMSRFWAIFAIVALGAGFFTGLCSTAPDMRITGDTYFDESNMMDLHLLSTFGFTEGDVAAIRETEGVLSVMPAHSADVSAKLGGNDQLTRIHSLPADFSAENPDYINRPVLQEGRMPSAPGECLAGKISFAGHTPELGDTITISDEDGKLSDNLKYSEYKIVGFINSAYYLSFTLGSTSMGNGKLSMYLYIADEDFAQEFVTDLFVTVNGAKELSTFSGAYGDMIKPVKSELENLAKKRENLRYSDIKDEAQKKLDDGQKEYDEKKVDADEQLADAAQKLADGAREIADNSKKLADARVELKDGLKKLADAEKEIEENEATLNDGEKEWSDGSNKLGQGQTDFEKGQKELDDKRTEANKAFKDAQNEIDSGQQSLSAGRTELEAQRPGYEMAVGNIDGVNGLVVMLGGMGDTRPPSGMSPMEILGMLQADPSKVGLGDAKVAQGFLSGSISAFEQGERALSDGGSQLASGQQELKRQKKDAARQFEEAQQTLDDAKKEIDENQALLVQKWDEIADGRQKLADGRKEIAENRKKLLDAQKELADGENELADARIELADGQIEYTDKKAEAEQKLLDAQQKIDDGRADLAELEMPEWFVLDRDTNVGFVSFKGDCDRLASLATVFPILFFLVAALVALTTMTRMVEEERVLIGTYKALGYGTFKIASKYLFYGALASVLGSAAGIALLYWSLPIVCWSAYSILYQAPPIILKFQWDYVLQACLASTACTLLATLAACLSTLKESPAALMLPRAPKAGKRILLERIAPIWKHLKFTQKVTCRNLFRYKKRLIMTVVGIAGCTGLLLTGFGIMDSVSSIIGNQFSHVYNYNTVIELKDNKLSTSLQKALEAPADFSDTMRAAVKTADVSANGVKLNGYWFVPQDPGKLKTFINLQERRSGKEVAFSEGDVLITEKLAARLGVGVGGSIMLENADKKEVFFTVTGVVENYVFHYVYISPVLFEEKMGAPPEYNQVLGLAVPQDADGQAALSKKLLALPNAATVSFTTDLSSGFDDMIKSLNYVIIVIILCAGALAFVVLYNLTNINVTERQREIATIKVLGFFDREVSAYIYRETALLTVIGCAVGLCLGVLMHAFVIQTVEVDAVMFGRNIAPLSFAYSAALTLFFSLIVNLVISRKLQKIDMVESLKSVD